VIFNLRELDGESIDAPKGRFSLRSLTEEVGAVHTGLSVYELGPGVATWPYHFELVEEEWLLVVDGEVTLRTPAGERVLRAGDVACFPAGAAGAHAVRNHTDEVARIAMPSTRAKYGDASVYPDSGKFRLSGPGFAHRGFLGDAVEYWQGEV
jgi:uncharacterized cupin superfamily protein